jgi:FkbM family methyltransferase
MIKEHIINTDGIELKFYDLETSETMTHMIEQVFEQDEYGLKKMNYNQGDVIVDIGANIGCVSIYLAKKYPDLKIISFEAHPTNYGNFVKNIESNGVTNIKHYNLAVSSKDGETVKITLNPGNTGSSSLYKINENDINTKEVKTISLDTIISENNISRIKFLKLDCEGSEFDILENSNLIHNILVENVSVEIHTFMESYNKNTDSLISLINQISENKPNCKVYTLG